MFWSAGKSESRWSRSQLKAMVVRGVAMGILWSLAPPPPGAFEGPVTETHRQFLALAGYLMRYLKLFLTECNVLIEVRNQWLTHSRVSHFHTCANLCSRAHYDLHQEDSQSTPESPRWSEGPSVGLKGSLLIWRALFQSERSLFHLKGPHVGVRGPSIWYDSNKLVGTLFGLTGSVSAKEGPLST